MDMLNKNSEKYVKIRLPAVNCVKPDRLLDVNMPCQIKQFTRQPEVPVYFTVCFLKIAAHNALNRYNRVPY